MTIAATRSGVPGSTVPTETVPDGTVQYLRIGALDLESGAQLPDVVLAYETWGTLNTDASNAVLIEHALTGDTHVTRGASEEPGWWEQLAGPGAPVDTDKYFVVSVNILGGCYGSTGPSTPAPDGRPWGSRFPLVTLRDTTAAEARLADALGIASWHAVLGGSLGGARALEWAVTFPERVRRCAVIRRSQQHSRTDCLRAGPDPGHPPGPQLQRRRLLRRPGAGGRARPGPPDRAHHLPLGRRT
jgi:homoserine O-acetyltransferase